MRNVENCRQVIHDIKILNEMCSCHGTDCAINVLNRTTLTPFKTRVLRWTPKRAKVLTKKTEIKIDIFSYSLIYLFTFKTMKDVFKDYHQRGRRN